MVENNRVICNYCDKEVNQEDIWGFKPDPFGRNMLIYMCYRCHDRIKKEWGL